MSHYGSEWIAYDVRWYNDTSEISIGTGGVLDGWYRRSGPVCEVFVDFKPGTGHGSPATTFEFTLPFTGVTTGGGGSWSATVWDDNGTVYSAAIGGLTPGSPPTRVRLYYNTSYVNSTTPFTWTVSDRGNMFGVYRVP